MADRSVLRRESTSLVQDLKDNATVLVGWTSVLWIVQIVNAVVFSGALIRFGVHPHSLGGILGVFFAPFLHAGFGHLIANTIPFVLLGALTMSRKRLDFVVVSVVSAITSGIGAWIFGASGSVHVGASGVIFGYLGFLLARGIYERSVSTIVLSVVVGWLFGGMLWGLLPFLYAGVSWQSHVFGFVGGFLTARLLGMERRRRGLVR